MSIVHAVSKVLFVVTVLLVTAGAALYKTSIEHRPEPLPVPTGVVVTYEGTFRFAFIEPSNGQEIMQQVFYLERNQHNYRLIFTGGIPQFSDGTKVKVTGTLVAPSSWNGTKIYHFEGDIYVQDIVEV